MYGLAPRSKTEAELRAEVRAEVLAERQHRLELEGAARGRAWAEPHQNANPAKALGSEMKKAALVAEYRHRWPSIEQDFRDAGRNGLSMKAKTKRHGFWREAKALEWARVQGKLQPEGISQSSYSTVRHKSQ